MLVNIYACPKKTQDNGKTSRFADDVIPLSYMQTKAKSGCKGKGLSDTTFRCLLASFSLVNNLE